MIKNRYIFICERTDEDNYIEEGRIELRENDLTYLPDVLSSFEQFLRGAGFYFDGHVGIINDKEEE